MKNRGEFELAYVEASSSRAEAMRREKEIKRYKGGVAFKKLLTGRDKQKMPHVSWLKSRPAVAGDKQL